MNKLANFRPLVVFALCMAGGVLACAFFNCFNLNSSWLVLCTLLLTASLVSLFWCVKTPRHRRRIIVLVLCSVCFSVGIVNTYFRFNAYDHANGVYGVTYQIEGDITDISRGEEYMTVRIQNVTLDGDRIAGKMNVYVAYGSGDQPIVGYRMSFSGKVVREQAYTYRHFNSHVISDIRYHASATSTVVCRYQFSLLGTVRQSIYAMLSRNADKDVMPIAYALLTGNVDAIEGATLQNFRQGGVAHLFAVSGLHIGILYGLLFAFFKLCRCGQRLRVVLASAVTLFYVGVCGFSPSSLRALIMCACFSVSYVLHQKNDSLNSLSLSALLLLCVQPLYLLSAGFILSYSALLGILLLSESLHHCLAFIPWRFRQLFVTSFSAQIGVFPPMLILFGSLGVWGIVINLWIVPLIALWYPILLISTLLSCIFPFIGAYIVPFATTPLSLLLSAVGSHTWQTFTPYHGVAIALLVVGVSLWSSRRFFFKTKTRLVGSAILAVLFSAILAVQSFAPFTYVHVYICATAHSEAVFLRHRGKVLAVISDEATKSDLSDFLTRTVHDKADAVLLLYSDELTPAIAVDRGICADYYLSNATFPFDYGMPCYRINEQAILSYQVKMQGVGACTIAYGNMVVAVNFSSNPLSTDNTQPITLAVNKYDIQQDAHYQAYCHTPHRKFNVYDCGSLQFICNRDTIKAYRAFNYSPTWN